MGKHRPESHGPAEEPAMTRPAYTPEPPLFPPPPLPATMTAPPKVRTPGKTAAIVALSLYGLVMTGVAIAGDTNGTTSAAIASTSSAFPSTSSTRKPSPSPTHAPVRRLTKSDLKLSVVETRRKCFGSAGCNVSYEVEATVLDMDAVTDDSYQVRYRVTAGSKEVVRDTFELNGTKYSIPEDFTMDVPEGVKLRASILSVKRLP